MAQILQPEILVLLLVGVLIGLVFGTIPGLSGITAVALLVPFSYAMGAEGSLVMMIGVYLATTCAGALAGILFNMPGDVMGAATATDGYPMTQRGEAGRAISLVITASAVGALLGALFLVVVAPQFLRIALNFGPPEYFALALLGMACVTSFATGSVVKALIAGVIGLLLATVGLDPVSGNARFVFGSASLQGGIDFIPAIIGFFAVSEILQVIYRGRPDLSHLEEGIRSVPRFALPSRDDLRMVRGTMARSALVGNGVGVLPGAGSTVAAFLGYGAEVQTSRHPERYGKGEPRGVVAPETANSAAAAASMMPLLTLGIPGGAVTAIMLGVFILNGLQPGPLLFENEPGLTYLIYAAFFVAPLLVLVIGFSAVRPLMRLLTIPFETFSTLVLVLAVVGAFSIYNRPVDLWVMLGCGIIGFFAKQYGFPVAALILGLVLGDIAESGLVSGMGVAGGEVGAFLSRPFTIGTLVLAVGLLVIPPVLQRRRTVRAASETDDEVEEEPTRSEG